MGSEEPAEPPYAPGMRKELVDREFRARGEVGEVGLRDLLLDRRPIGRGREKERWAETSYRWMV